MNSLWCPARHAIKFGSQHIRQLTASRCVALGVSTFLQRRCEPEPEALALAITTPSFWEGYKATFRSDRQSFPWDFKFFKESPRPYSAYGYLISVTNLSDSLAFGRVWSGTGPESEKNVLQIICRDPKQCTQLKGIRLNSPISVVGRLGIKHARKKAQDEALPPQGPLLLHQIEMVPTQIICLNNITNPHISAEHKYPPSSRHLQIRFDAKLKSRLHFRSSIAAFIREKCLNDFQEVETPILFKSTPEGAREFLVPTRKAGYAYALPQSPQQYKQILMASGIPKYFQFAKCFRDEDLRADRQPEFTQLDMEMAYATGVDVRTEVEKLVKAVYNFCLKDSLNQVSVIRTPLPDKTFYTMQYSHAMRNYGSDKPDLRINALILNIDGAVPAQLRSMLTSIPNPNIEAFKLRLNAPPKDVQKFIQKFMDSPEAETFRSNVDGAPGICVFDSSKPVEGLQAFGFEGAKELKAIWDKRGAYVYEDQDLVKRDKKFEDGDLIIIQAREKLPFSGGSTALGRLRLAIYKAAIAENLIEPDLSHHFVWVTEFPMFTTGNASDPGQGGNAGFSATHHPFTAPNSERDLDLLLTNPLRAKADHYDLVVNGIELGGGSCRIHNADMQRFIMRDILKMSPKRMNDFSHLLTALESGCPPHAGFAIGFDRFIAFLTGCESVKDVIAFPKSSKGEDMMVRSPSKITDAELARYHLLLVGGEPNDTTPDFRSNTVVPGASLDQVIMHELTTHEVINDEPGSEDAIVQEVIAEDPVTEETIVEKQPVAEKDNDGDSATDTLSPKH